MSRIIPNEETFIGFTTSAPGALAAPGAPTLTTATTGGTLPAATYKYEVVARTVGGGHTAASASATQITTGTSSTVTVTMPVVTGEDDGFDIYGRSNTGAIGRLATVAHGTNTWVDTGAATPGAAAPTVSTAGNLSSPTAADVGGCIDLTPFVASINASATGNVVPTPSLSTLFETSIIGTSQATFTGDFYRDDENDIAWETLTRRQKGWFLITRYGGRPAAGDPVEVWPVIVVSRSMANMTSNTVETFTLTCSVPNEPAEDAVVAA